MVEVDLIIVTIGGSKDRSPPNHPSLTSYPLQSLLSVAFFSLWRKVEEVCHVYVR